MKKGSTLIVPVAAFSIAIVMSLLAGGGRFTFARQQGGATCQAALTKACVQFTNYTENINNLTTITSAPDRGNTTLKAQVTYGATYDINYKNKKP